MNNFDELHFFRRTDQNPIPGRPHYFQYFELSFDGLPILEMKNNNETLLTAFALFSLFFGAGNLILPPFLGFRSGGLWWAVALGFCISAVLVPILGILAHARLQGTIFDFGKKVSPTFSLVYSYLVYAISISLPSPRTASVTHEIAVQPYFNIHSWLTSTVYFVFVFFFVMNRSRILNILGKYLTPAIILILLAIIGVTLFGFDINYGGTGFANPFTEGVLEGYQTFDAIGAVVVGGVIIVSVNLKKNHASYDEKKRLIRRAGWLAGLALFIIYAGLIITGASMYGQFNADISRTALLNGISSKTLGVGANLLLGLLVALACFTTAVGIVTGTADFVKHRFQGSSKAYWITAAIGCFLGILMGQFDVQYIIRVAVPALMFIYPITIVLILLNVMPEKYASVLVFRVVVITTFIFSIPDFLSSLGSAITLPGYLINFPLSEYKTGWILPAFAIFVFTNVIAYNRLK